MYTEKPKVEMVERWSTWYCSVGKQISKSTTTISCQNNGTTLSRYKMQKEIK